MYRNRGNKRLAVLGGVELKIDDTFFTSAANNEILPDGLSYPQQCLYLAMRGLYQQHKSGFIPLEVAVHDKAALLSEYEKAEALHSKYLATWQTFSEQIKVSDEFRVKLKTGLRDGENLQELFELACTCVAVLTGDSTLSGSKVKQLMLCQSPNKRSQ